MQYFQFILLNRESFIASCFSTHTLLNGLIRYLTELFSPDQVSNFPVNCAKKCSPLKINANTVDKRRNTTGILGQLVDSASKSSVVAGGQERVRSQVL